MLSPVAIALLCVAVATAVPTSYTPSAAYGGLQSYGYYGNPALTYARYANPWMGYLSTMSTLPMYQGLFQNYLPYGGYNGYYKNNYGYNEKNYGYRKGGSKGTSKTTGYGGECMYPASSVCFTISFHTNIV